MTVLKIKAAVRTRDEFRCTECGMTNAAHVDVHRETPGSEYTVSGCVALCRRCHYGKRSPKWTQDIEQVKLRFSDARLARLVADRAERLRRSVNQQILFTLEEIERAEGLWPPKE